MLALVASAAADLESQLAAGDFAGAEQSLEKLAADWETAATTPEDKVEWARVLMALGTIERKLLQPEEAVEHLRIALDLLEAHAPDQAGSTREVLALTLQDQGKLAEAERLFRRNLSTEHSNSIAHLGILRLQQGDYEEAGALLNEAYEKTDPDRPSDLARRHQDLGRYWHTLGSHARALQHFEEGLRSLDGGGPSIELRLSLISHQALSLLRLHEVNLARARFEEAAEIARKIFANRPLEALPHLENLGILALATDDPESASQHFTEALSLLADYGYAEHPAAITALNNLGVTQMKLEAFQEAKETLLGARELQRKHLPEIHLRVAETERNIAAACLLAKDEETAKWVKVANQTGLELLDQLLRQGSETERLNFLERIDLLSLSCTLGDAKTIANLLLASKSRLLDQLIHPGESVPTPSWQDIQSILEVDSLFLDFCRYTPPGGVTRYGAILLRSEGPPRWIPLTTETQLDAWLDALHKRLAWKSDELMGSPSKSTPFRLTGILRELHRELLEPILKDLPKTCQRWIVAPDGLLHLTPFAALRDDHGQFLCQSLELLSQVGSGRDLLIGPPTRALGDSPWLLAGVSRFPSENLDPASHLASVLDHPTPLPGTRSELKKIRRLAPERITELLEVSELELKNLASSPRVLHLSTHSFFLNHVNPTDAPLDFDRSADRLFASGILLHRAGLRSPDTPIPAPNDDLLFPSEIAELPLAETRLVTLSSCLSGAGTAVQGEGQIGLRRAFALAGAREVITSLWPVSDQGSPDFMERFYQLALATENPAQALWQTQREFLSDADDLEAAVLLSAPFTLTQRGPALPLGEIPPPSSSFPWAWMIPVPLFLFLIARFSRPKRGRS